MSFGQNLQFLRKMRNGITQEELAEKINVSRQTVSKWELDASFPDMEKVIELCEYFSCSMDQLVRENINISNEAYSDIRVEEVLPFKYVKYIVISEAPEDDAINHIKHWATGQGINKPEIIGWDFPYVSQEQINIYHMHGYAAACILPSNFQLNEDGAEIIHQKSQKYACITIRDPFKAPFALIPNAYKTLMSYMKVNNIKHRESKDYLSCFEKSYEKNGISYMDIYISVEL